MCAPQWHQVIGHSTLMACSWKDCKMSGSPTGASCRSVVDGLECRAEHFRQLRRLFRAAQVARLSCMGRLAVLRHLAHLWPKIPAFAKHRGVASTHHPELSLNDASPCWSPPVDGQPACQLRYASSCLWHSATLSCWPGISLQCAEGGIDMNAFNPAATAAATATRQSRDGLAPRCCRCPCARQQEVSSPV